MFSHVCDEVRTLAERLGTNRAFVRFLSCKGMMIKCNTKHDACQKFLLGNRTYRCECKCAFSCLTFDESVFHNIDKGKVECPSELRDEWRELNSV